MHINVLRQYKLRVFVLGLIAVTVAAGGGSWAVSADITRGTGGLGPVLYGSDGVGIPGRVPRPPRIVEVKALDGAVHISWRQDEDSGSFPVSHFRVLATPGQGTCLVQLMHECVVRGLINGMTYRFTVSALNGAGWSSASQLSPEVAPEPTAESPNESTPPPTAAPDMDLDLILDSMPVGGTERVARFSLRPVAKLAEAPRLTVRSKDRFALLLTGFTPARQARIDYRTSRSWQRLTQLRSTARGVIQLRFLAVTGNGDISVRVGVSPKRARFLVISAS